MSFLHKTVSPKTQPFFRVRNLYVHAPSQTFIFDANKNLKKVDKEEGEEFAEALAISGATKEEIRQSWLFFCRELLIKLELVVQFVRQELLEPQGKLESYPQVRSILYRVAWQRIFGEQPLPESYSSDEQLHLFGQMKTLDASQLQRVYELLVSNREGSLALELSLYLFQGRDLGDEKPLLIAEIDGHIRAVWPEAQTLPYPDAEFDALRRSYKDRGIADLCVQPHNLQAELEQFVASLLQKLK